MKKITQNLIAPVLCSLTLCHATALLAETSESAEDLSGGFLKIGYGYKFEQNPYENEKNGLALFVSGRYQMENGLFVEASYGTNKRKEGLNIGCNFYNLPSWNFDITTVQAFGDTEIIAHLVEFGDEDEVLKDIRVVDKKSSSEMLGFRATGTFGQTNLQFVVAPLLLNDDYDDGIYSSLWVAQSWQAKNWEFYATAGVEYRSEKIIAHYFEPTIELQSVGFPAYDASGGFDFTAQVGTSYPISENILFESYLRYTDLADSITDSPIIRAASQIPGRDENATEFGVLFSYVF